MSPANLPITVVASDIPPVVRYIKALNAEIVRLQAECDKYHEHSVLLNKVCFAIDDAMGLVPEGADSYYDEVGIEARLDGICALIRSATT